MFQTNDLDWFATATNTANDNAFGEKELVFKNNAPFINCISKINGVKIDNAEDLDVVMPMYNLLEYSKNYRKTTGSLWNYYRDEPNSGVNNGITYSISGSKSFDYKANFIEDGVTHNNLTKDDVKIAVPLKYLSNFWRSLNIPLINCEVELILTWFKNCVLISKATREADYDADPIVYEIDNPEDATFQITDTKLYVPVVTLSKENDIKLLEQLKSGFKRTIKWNKYRSQMTVQPQNNNLNYLIDPTFTNVNRLFVLLFARTDVGDNRHFSRLLCTKRWNWHIDLSKQAKLKYPQHNNFIGKLESNGATMFFIIEKTEETSFDFSQNSVIII